MARSNFPRELGACIDRAYQLRAKRQAYEREVKGRVDAMKAEEQALEDHIIDSFTRAEIAGAKGRIATASVTPSTVASVKDWDVFMQWVAKRKAWDMVQRRVNNAAFRLRLDDGVAVPGVEPFNKVSLSLTKR